MPKFYAILCAILLDSAARGAWIADRGLNSWYNFVRTKNVAYNYVLSVDVFDNIFSLRRVFSRIIAFSADLDCIAGKFLFVEHYCDDNYCH